MDPVTSGSDVTTPLQAFGNTTEPAGGDSRLYDLNVFYESGDIAWMLVSTALVLLMIPGVGCALPTQSNRARARSHA